MGIDPGTTNAGVSLVDISLDKEYLDALYFTISGTTRIRTGRDIDSADTSEALERSRDRILAQMRNIKDIVRYYSPDEVAVETPYFNRFTPTAYKPLVEFRVRLETLLSSEFPNLPVFFYEPALIKKIVGSSNKDKKEGVRTALKNLDFFKMLDLVRLDTVDHNAVDSLAIAYTHIHKR